MIVVRNSEFVNVTDVNILERKYLDRDFVFVYNTFNPKQKISREQGKCWTILVGVSIIVARQGSICNLAMHDLLC